MRAWRLHRCVGSICAVLLLASAVYAQASPDEPAAILVYRHVALHPQRISLRERQQCVDEPVLHSYCQGVGFPGW
jgi:hypothetical protein